jgi:hypothetical protein
VAASWAVGWWAGGLLVAVCLASLATVSEHLWFAERDERPVADDLAADAIAVVRNRALLLADAALAQWAPSPDDIALVTERERTGAPDTAVRDTLRIAVVEQLARAEPSLHRRPAPPSAGRAAARRRADLYRRLYIPERASALLREAVGVWRPSSGWDRVVRLYAGGMSDDLVARIGLLELVGYTQCEYQLRVHGTDVADGALARWRPQRVAWGYVGARWAAGDERAAAVYALLDATSQLFAPEPAANQHEEVEAWLRADDVRAEISAAVADATDRWRPDDDTSQLVGVLGTVWGANARQRHVAVALDAALRQHATDGSVDLAATAAPPLPAGGPALWETDTWTIETKRSVLYAVLRRFGGDAARRVVAVWQPSADDVDRVLGWTDDGETDVAAEVAIAAAAAAVGFDWDADSFLLAGGEGEPADPRDRSVVADVASSRADVVAERVAAWWEPPDDVVDHLVQLWVSGRENVALLNALRWGIPRG